VTAWTELFGDADPANDTSTGQCFVRVRDVGVTEILAPRDTVDSGTAIIPQATLHNSGTDTANFYAHFRIDAWTDSVLVDLMWPGEDRLIQSPSAWPGNAAGPMTVRCSTGWAVDPNPRNDTMSRGFFVRWPHFKDLAATAILSPGSAVRESATVTPSGIIGGSTTEPATFMAYFKICNAGGVVYEDSQPGLVNPGTTDTVDFLPWLAAPQGAYTDSLKVVADGDRNPTNDTASSMFQVMAGFHDVGVVSILSPADTIQTGPVTPTVIVKNYGSFPETFTARFRVTPGYIPTYYDSAVISGLAPDSSVVVAFPVWNASSGTHVSRCSLEVADIQPGNDWQEKTVFVESLQIPFGWYPMKDYPGGAAGKMVKDGGWLVYDPGTRLIFCAKGNKTAEFAAYYQVGDSWQALASIPLGLEAKATSKGGAGCSDGNGTLYATKGNNTLGFHQYAYAGNSWLQKKDVPIGVYGKKVKGGTSLCHALSQGQPWVYMLKGYKNEFWRYDPVGDTWDSLDMAPVGANLKWDKGSWIVYDGNHTIYAHKAKYFEFYAYDTDTDIWFDTLRPMPKPGATGDKKPGDGGCGAWDNGTIMAMKGNNTQQVWRYFAAQDAWIEQDTIPKGTSGKKVKAGAGMVSPSRGIFFATKGNKTLDFWRYRPATGTGVREQYTAALALPEGTELQVRPNPFSRTALVGVPSAAGALLLRVYDIRGNVVHEQVARAGWNNLDLTGAPPGVYFLRPGSANVCARLVKE
jgi:hypothetical protein